MQLQLPQGKTNMLSSELHQIATRILEHIAEEFWSCDVTPGQAREVIGHVRWALTVPATLQQVLPDDPEPPLTEQTHPSLTACERNRNIKGVPV